MKRTIVLLPVFLYLPSLLAQSPNVQVNRENRTIAVTADDSVEVPAEVAVVEVGCHTINSTKEAAYEENVRIADQIIKAMHDMGVKDDQIQTEKLELGRVEDDARRLLLARTNPGLIDPKVVQFEAKQSLKVFVVSTMAQHVVDAAVRAGANVVEDLDWNVADPVSLQSKASAAALAKARMVAEQMAASLNAKLGPLIYASNRAPAAGMYFSVNGMSENVGTDASRSTISTIPLTLFPQKVKSQATVYAIFAIE